MPVTCWPKRGRRRSNWATSGASRCSSGIGPHERVSEQQRGVRVRRHGMKQSSRSMVRRSAVTAGGDFVVGLMVGRLTSRRHGPDQQTPVSPHNGREGQGYKIPFPEVVYDLNAFWQRAYGAAGPSYRAPTVETLTAPIVTACGPAGPETLAFYCPAEEAVYCSPAGLAEHRRRIGDFAPIVVMAHE